MRSLNKKEYVKIIGYGAVQLCASNVRALALVRRTVVYSFVFLCFFFLYAKLVAVVNSELFS